MALPDDPAALRQILRDSATVPSTAAQARMKLLMMGQPEEDPNPFDPEAVQQARRVSAGLDLISSWPPGVSTKLGVRGEPLPPEYFQTASPEAPQPVSDARGGATGASIQGRDVPPAAEQPEPAEQPAIAVPQVRLDGARRELRTGREQAEKAGEFRQEQAEAFEQEADLKLQAADESARIYKEHVAEVAELQQIRRADINDKVAQLNNFADQYAYAAEQGTRPAANLIEDRTSAGVVATIVHGLGAIAQIISQGNTNPLADVASSIVGRAEKAIERDIQAKMRRLDTLKTGMSMADRQLQNLRNLFDDDRAFVDWAVKLQLAKEVDPILKRAEASKNLGMAAAARAAGAEMQSRQADSRANIQVSLAAQAQRGAELALRARQAATETKYQHNFEIDQKMFGKTVAKDVATEWSNAETFLTIAPKLVQLREKMSQLGKLGDFAAWLSGDQTVRNTYKALVRDVFGTDADLGKALTAVEIEFGEQKLGDPMKFLTSAESLRQVLKERSRIKISNLLNMTNQYGAVTKKGRAQVAQWLTRLGGGSSPAKRPLTKSTR